MRILSLGIVAVICGVTGFVGVMMSLMLLTAPNTSPDTQRADSVPQATSPVGPQAAVQPLSPVFSPEVLYWSDLIRAWAILYEVDPNLLATIIQIESCGYPGALSYAGAQGLFQVMPFHFLPGEDYLDPNTNAHRGIAHLLFSLQSYDNHFGLALAAYNGGVSGVQNGWSNWGNGQNSGDQPRRYYLWGTRIYADAVSGRTTSPAVQAWLAADERNHPNGPSLCERARAAQQQLDEQADAPLAG
ncbi:MAG: transglycosylase SLT domain-containing protein [Chloroflexi bacterium]|nr:transglycosylase SLT domain-containing protein [Chloroflexota bacterium]